MAKKQSGLGKGLEALFADNSQEEQRVENIRITDVEPNRDQPRKNFDEAALEELAESIRQHGVIQPILVRPVMDGSYVIVAGERRWRAARIAGLEEVPVIVRDMDDEQAAQLALIENLQREDLNPMEEAFAIRQLMNVYGFSQEQVAEKIGKSRSDVANKLRLLGLPEEIGGYVAQGKISAGHARALLAVEDEKKRSELVKEILEGRITVRAVENAAKNTKEEKKKNGSGKKASWETHTAENDKDGLMPLGESFFNEMELALTQELHRKVKISHGQNGKGSIEIEFYNREELTQLAKKLSR
ncbi:MAG: ParB/RepB/Spo0J family partition protein [Ruminococcaceae bacterium]|nr:ParB/RepB/Spo0J family partition protein [Oscillospiraceae bacterium]